MSVTHTHVSRDTCRHQQVKHVLSDNVTWLVRDSSTTQSWLICDSSAIRTLQLDSYRCGSAAQSWVWRVNQVTCESFVWRVNHLCGGEILRSHAVMCDLVCMTWLMHIYDSFVRVKQLIHMYDMTHSYVWHDSFICVTWLVCESDMTYPYAGHDTFTCCRYILMLR